LPGKPFTKRSTTKSTRAPATLIGGSHERRRSFRIGSS
jgi:hypothetical protein